MSINRGMVILVMVCPCYGLWVPLEYVRVNVIENLIQAR